MIVLNLLGGAECRLEDGKIIAFPTRKAFAVLAYLAGHPGERVHRDKLAAMFWEGVGDSQARSSLRQAIARIKVAVGASDIFLATGDALAINHERVGTDVMEFLAVADRGDVASLDQASAIYQGEFLAGFSVRGAPLFDEWVALERQGLRELALKALTARLDRTTASGNIEAAIRAAIRVLSVDPFQEHAHRMLMQLYARQGRVGTAISHYHDLSAALRRNLDIEPEPATRSLFRQLRELRRSASAQALSDNRGNPVSDRLTLGSSDQIDKLKVAVLPFANVTDKPDLDYLGSGLADGIIASLTRVSHLVPMSRFSSFGYASSRDGVRSAGEELDVQYILHGSILQVGDRYRANAQLVSARDYTVIWSENFDTTGPDLFAVQDEIAANVSASVEHRIILAEAAQIRRRPSSEWEAYDHYLRAMESVLGPRDTDFPAALQHAREALRLNPDFPQAAGLLVWIAVQAPEQLAATDISELLRLCDLVVEQAPDDAELLALVGLAYAHISRDWSRAVALVERATEVNPFSVTGWVASGYVRMFNGELERPQTDFDRADQLSRRNLLSYAILAGRALAHLQEGDFEAALAYAERSLVANRGFRPAWRALAVSQYLTGRCDEALDTVRALRAIAPGESIELLRRALPYRRPEMIDSMCAILGELGLPRAGPADLHKQD